MSLNFRGVFIFSLPAPDVKISREEDFPLHEEEYSGWTSNLYVRQISSGSQVILPQILFSLPRDENVAENELWYAFPMHSEGTE